MSLITVTDYTSLSGNPDPSGDPMKLNRLNALISGASAQFESATNRTFLSGSLATETFDGLGFVEEYCSIHNTYTPNEGLIVGTPTLEYRTSSAWSTVSKAWAVDSTSNYIYFTDYNYFTKDLNYRIQYEYGYNGVANIPWDIKIAVVTMVQLAEQSIKYAGISSETTQDLNTRSIDLKFPSTVRSTISKYTR